MIHTELQSSELSFSKYGYVVFKSYVKGLLLDFNNVLIILVPGPTGMNIEQDKMNKTTYFTRFVAIVAWKCQKNPKKFQLRF